MTRMIDLTGQVFNRLTVIDRADNAKGGQARWNCICECGNARIVIGSKLISGWSKSCGCYGRDQVAKARTTHGMSHTPTHDVWKGMRDRCTNKNAKVFKYYGGRGIAVCDRWKKFENFYADMGEKPKNRSIDRIDNDGDYTPENCRWATRAQQANNTCRTIHIFFNGKTQTMVEWANEMNITRNALYERYRRGIFPPKHEGAL